MVVADQAPVDPQRFEKELFCLLQAPEVEAYHSKVVEYLTRIHVLPAGCTRHRLEKFSERPFGIDQATLILVHCSQVVKELHRGRALDSELALGQADGRD